MKRRRESERPGKRRGLNKLKEHKREYLGKEGRDKSFH
jgi:hypothetical protein